MEKKQPQTIPTPDPKSRFAEVTRRAREERAKKPRQVPNEERPNPYKVDLPAEPLKEKEG